MGTKPTRYKNGKYRSWKGGKTARKNCRSWHGTRVRIGKEFSRQNGRGSRTGDIVRDHNNNGSYNKGSPWHIKTSHGWRKSPTGSRKPSQSQIRRTIKISRPGR